MAMPSRVVVTRQENDELQENRRTHGHQKAKRRGRSPRQHQVLSETESDDSEEEDPVRKPLSTVYVEKQQSQRVKHHPNNKMSSKKRGSTGGKQRSAVAKRKKTDPQDSEDEGTTETSVALASESSGTYHQKVLLDLQKDLAKYNGRDKSKRVSQKDKTEMEKLVYIVSKHQLFKQVKYLNAKSLDKACLWVFNWIKPKEFKGMPEEIEGLAKTTWINRYRDEVRKGINDKRTNIQQEMLKLFKKKLTDEQYEVLFWKPDEVWNLILRKGLDEGDDNSEANQAKFDFLVDEVLPKFATTDAWGPNYRHTTPMYEAEQDIPEGKPQLMCVSTSDLAYVHSYFVTYGGQLHWEYKKDLGTLTNFGDDHKVVEARGKASYQRVNEAGKTETIYCDERPAPVHSKAEGGRCPFGGWQKEGIAIYKAKRAELQKLYGKGKKTPDSKRMQKADEACLARLRTKHNRDRVEEKRQARGKGKGGGSQDDDDEGDDFGD